MSVEAAMALSFAVGGGVALILASTNPLLGDRCSKGGRCDLSETVWFYVPAGWRWREGTWASNRCRKCGRMPDKIWVCLHRKSGAQDVAA